MGEVGSRYGSGVMGRSRKMTKTHSLVDHLKFAYRENDVWNIRTTSALDF
jgi:hypothetical protein